jgi:hypothetical protein
MEKRKTTTSNAVKDKWKADHYDVIRLYLDKDTADEYKALCAALGQPISQIPKQAIINFMTENQ